MVRFQADADLNQILLIASATSPEDWTNRICYLPV